MDPRINPYAPGAGTIPPELAGRSDIIEKVSIALDRCRNGLSSRGFLCVGLRGVGKTVLLTRMSQEADTKGFMTLFVETPEKRSLPALLIPALRTALLKLSRAKDVEETVKRMLRILGSFIAGMKLTYHDIEFGLDLEKEAGLADTGDLEYDLATLLIEIGKAAKNHKTALVLFIDEVQYIDEDQFGALIMAIHKCTQQQLPVILIGAGLPQLVGQAGRAKSYAERLFEYPEIGPLTTPEAKKALIAPAAKLDVQYTNEALSKILYYTQSYPYFLQEWGKHSWESAAKSPITEEDVDHATALAISELDASFFRVRFDRLTANEKKYLRAMAELDPGPHRSGDIATLLSKDVQKVAPVRATLIKKGMIFSQAHGDNQFTVPLFGEFIKRIMPSMTD